MIHLRCTAVLIAAFLLILPTHIQAQDAATAPAATGAPAAAPTSAPAPAAAENAPEGIWIIFSGGIIGFLMILLLFALSLTAAYLVFEHVMTLRRSELMPEGLGEAVRDSLATGKVRQANEACQARPSFLSFVLISGMAEVEGGWPAVEKALEDALAEQSARLFRKIEYLSVIGNIAPMVGLLGTVIGMIFAFQQVASTSGSAGAGELAEGIYQALITTVGGLLVAIPSLGAFAIFRNRVDQLVAEAAYVTQHAMAPLKRMRKTKATSSTPPPAPPK